MAKPRRMFVDIDYGQMHIRVSTPAKKAALPLICLHMSPKSGRFFANFMEKASDDRLMVAPDYPGMGESDAPPAEPAVTIQDYARSVWQALDTLEIKRVDLLGHHTGSLVAAEMAHQRPEQVHSIVMISALVLSAGEKTAFEARFLPVPLDEAGTRFTRMWDAIRFHRGPGMTLDMMAVSLAESMRGGNAYEWGHRAAFAYNDYFPDVVSKLGQRITVFNPKDDLYDITPRVADLLRNGCVIDKPDWGHGLFDTMQQEVASAVKAVLI